MGSIFSTILDTISGWGQSEKRILMLGLDAAGKTTILYRLQLGEDVHSVPTIGFNVEQVNYKNISFTIWDVGGQDKLRALWRHYFKDNDAIIWVVDTADRDRIDEAKSELHKLLAEPMLSDSIVLVYANKADLPNAVPAGELVQRFELDTSIGQRRAWYVQPSCATTGEGLFEGLDWLSSKLRERRAKGSAGGGGY
nr:Arf1c [Vischeria sp. CAUP Q 202]